MESAEQISVDLRVQTTQSLVSAIESGNVDALQKVMSSMLNPLACIPEETREDIDAHVGQGTNEETQGTQEPQGTHEGPNEGTNEPQGTHLGTNEGTNEEIHVAQEIHEAQGATTPSRAPDDVIFRAFKEFVSDLGHVYAEAHHSLALYDRLLEKTMYAKHRDAVSKHLAGLDMFCRANEQAILCRLKSFTGTIRYSERVFIDLNQILSGDVDADTYASIFNHLVVLLVYINPTTESIEAAKRLRGNDLNFDFTPENPEDELLAGVFQKVREVADKDAVSNPTQAISKLFSSGMVGSLTQAIENGAMNGSLDLSKIVKSVNKIVSGNPEVGANPMVSNMLGMIQNMPGLGRR